MKIDLIKHIEESLEKSNALISKLPNEILTMPGMSGRKTRHFYNNICNTDCKYLEIGTWAGSSLCSAMYGNKIKCVAIDNWSQFGGPKDVFMAYFNKYKGDNDATFIESDCWAIDPTNLGKFDIYMYDGGHSEEDHYKALSSFLPCLENRFIYLVDDWNEKSIQNATNKSIVDNKLDIYYKKEIFEKNPMGIQRGDNDWHNGLCIFILDKP